MNRLLAWRKEPGVRVAGSRGLDRFKVQAPGVVALPGGGYRLFYTAVGPDKPFADCQGCILSAVSDDGLTFEVEPGIRVAPDPGRPELSLRALAPSVTPIDGGWRMYFEGRGPADRPTVIASAVSADLLQWQIEPGLRMAGSERCGAPRFLPLGGPSCGEGAGRLVHFRTDDGPPRRSAVYSAITEDGLSFTREEGVRMSSRTGDLDSSGITAAEVTAPEETGAPWVMIYSAWQDVPPGTEVPLHPSHDPDAVASGRSADFAAASIAVDLCGYVRASSRRPRPTVCASGRAASSSKAAATTAATSTPFMPRTWRWCALPTAAGACTTRPVTPPAPGRSRARSAPDAPLPRGHRRPQPPTSS